MPPNEPEVEFMFSRLSRADDLPSHRPIFDRLIVDDQGGFWVRVPPDESVGSMDFILRDRVWPSETWTVFNSAGSLLGDIRLPDGFNLRAIGRSRVFGVVRDSLHVESVQVHKIRR